jgi:hypothetical protein
MMKISHLGSGSTAINKGKLSPARSFYWPEIGWKHADGELIDAALPDLRS